MNLENITEILSFLDLTDDWDGDGAEKISHNAILSALLFEKLYEGAIKFDYGALCDGGIDIGAYEENYRILAECCTDGKIAWLIRKGEDVKKGSGITVQQFIEILKND